MRIETVTYSYDTIDEYKKHLQEMKDNKFTVIKTVSKFDDCYLEVEYQNMQFPINKIYGKVISYD